MLPALFSAVRGTCQIGKSFPERLLCSGNRANLPGIFDSFRNNHRKSAKNALFPLDTENQLAAWYRTDDAKTRMDTGENAFLLRHGAIR